MMFEDIYAITLDIDWVSDSVLEYIARPLIENQIKATWFVTHKSSAIQELKQYPELFELGIYPNFYKNSSQGKSAKEILDYLMDIVPQANTVRTHSLYQNPHLLSTMCKDYGINNDVSLLLVDTPGIVPHELYFDKTNHLLRIPYFWEDDTEMVKPQATFCFQKPKFHNPGMKIFDFHPIHIALNSYDISLYEEFKRRVNVGRCTMGDLISNRHNGEGTENLYHALIDHLKTQGGGWTISEIAEEWSLHNENRRDWPNRTLI